MQSRWGQLQISRTRAHGGSWISNLLAIFNMTMWPHEWAPPTSDSYYGNLTLFVFTQVWTNWNRKTPKTAMRNGIRYGCEGVFQSLHLSCLGLSPELVAFALVETGPTLCCKRSVEPESRTQCHLKTFADAFIVIGNLLATSCFFTFV